MPSYVWRTPRPLQTARSLSYGRSPFSFDLVLSTVTRLDSYIAHLHFPRNEKQRGNETPGTMELVVEKISHKCNNSEHTTKTITIQYTNIGTMEVSNLNQKIEQLRTEFRPRNRESCKDALELVNNDVDKARALLKAIGPPLHSIQSQDSSSTTRTYGPTHSWSG